MHMGHDVFLSMIQCDVYNAMGMVCIVWDDGNGGGDGGGDDGKCGGGDNGVASDNNMMSKVGSGSGGETKGREAERV